MLEILSLSTGYGAIEVLSQASIVVEPGTMVTLIGPNGAGKTTLLNTVSGFLKPRSGSIRFDGHVIDGVPPYRIAQAGLIQVPEGRQILGPLTVEENLYLGRLAAGSRAAASGDDLDRVFSLFPVLAERRHQRGDVLSGGQQQMLAIGRGLMGRPRILMLDEPSLGLAPLVVSQVFAALKTLNEEGLSILLVEQNARRALEWTSYGYVLEQGRVVHQGASSELARDPKIIEHYLGRDRSAIAVSSRSSNPSRSEPYASE